MPGDRSRQKWFATIRRDQPIYVLSITAVAVASWWLIVVSQTPLGGLVVNSPQAPRAPAAKPGPGEPHSAAAQVRRDYVEAQSAVFAARAAVDAARRGVASAEHDWEECLAARAARETQQAARLREATAKNGLRP